MSSAKGGTVPEQAVPQQFLEFFDDAATFPPGLAPVEVVRLP